MLSLTLPLICACGLSGKKLLLLPFSTRLWIMLPTMCVIVEFILLLDLSLVLVLSGIGHFAWCNGLCAWTVISYHV